MGLGQMSSQAVCPGGGAAPASPSRRSTRCCAKPCTVPSRCRLPPTPTPHRRGTWQATGCLEFTGVLRCSPAPSHLDHLPAQHAASRRLQQVLPLRHVQHVQHAHHRHRVDPELRGVGGVGWGVRCGRRIKAGPTAQLVKGRHACTRVHTGRARTSVPAASRRLKQRKLKGVKRLRGEGRPNHTACLRGRLLPRQDRLTCAAASSLTPSGTATRLDSLATMYCCHVPLPCSTLQAGQQEGRATVQCTYAGHACAAQH